MISWGFQWCIQWVPDVSLPVWVPKPCAQIRKKLMQNNIDYIFNHIFNTNASTPSQTFNLSNTLKIVELKTICMPVSPTEVCLNVSQSIVCKNKLSLNIVLGCPNLPLDTELDLVVRIKLSSFTGTVAIRQLDPMPNPPSQISNASKKESIYCGFYRFCTNCKFYQFFCFFQDYLNVSLCIL